jgi:microsomal dipeptidase-like Zn-dependent dipeptidase
MSHGSWIDHVSLSYEHLNAPCDVAIIDLDNCISEDKWRWDMFDLHLPVISDRYTRYHNACEGDNYCNQEVIRQLSKTCKLIACTSRPESVRIKTQRWANRHRIPLAGLMMRPENNHQPSVPLKRAMIRALPRHLKLQHAIDDRADILEMYADEGVRMVRRVWIRTSEIVHP